VPEYHDDLLSTAQRLVRRRKDQRGKLSAASVRRSVSTAYYALFHFVLDQAARVLVGTGGDLRRRRRILVRLFSHAGIRATFDKVRGPSVDKSVEDFLRPRGVVGGPVASPHFARELASAFSDAQAKRHDADYDLNKPISEADARVLISRVRHAIDAWQAADTPADRDFKRAICTLMLLKGQLRQER
jgi:uncharacterized protein (UPF0332 family)